MISSSGLLPSCASDNEQKRWIVSKKMHPLLYQWLSNLQLPFILSHGKCIGIGLAVFTALGGFIVGGIMIACFPLFLLGSLLLIVAAIYIIIVSGLVSLGGSLYMMSWAFGYGRAALQANEGLYPPNEGRELQTMQPLLPDLGKAH